MTFLLDTNICSAHLRRPAGMAHRLLQYSGRLAVTSIALAELYAGAYHRRERSSLLQRLEELLKDLEVLDFDCRCAERFGVVRGGLLRQGISVNTVDLMIASVALVNDLTLVTHNTVDFRNVPELRLDDWITG